MRIAAIENYAHTVARIHELRTERTKNCDAVPSVAHVPTSSVEQSADHHNRGMLVSGHDARDSL